MRKTVLLLLLWGIVAIPVAAQVASKASCVSVSALLERDHLQAGDTTAVVVMLTPAEDIHVNAEPPVGIRLDSSGSLQPVGTPVQDVNQRTGRLVTSSPVRLTLKVAAGSAPGAYETGATIIYYYCSETEGWCMRGSQRVRLPFAVVPAPHEVGNGR